MVQEEMVEDMGIRYWLMLTWMYPVMGVAYTFAPKYNKYADFHGSKGIWSEVKQALRREYD